MPASNNKHSVRIYDILQCRPQLQMLRAALYIQAYIIWFNAQRKVSRKTTVRRGPSLYRERIRQFCVRS